MLKPAYTASSSPSNAFYTNNTLFRNDPTFYWRHDGDHPVYIIIDLKSFYASVECVLRDLDPMTTDLVVADPERGEGTICLAVSPSLKKKGVSGRARIYEIPSCLEYIIAVPRMAEYERMSARVYAVYLQYFSKDDIHVYSCDEAFIDVTTYLDLYQMTPKTLGIEVMNAVLDATGLRSTCGIGTNLYLAKIALDIVSKKSPDFIGILDEDSYRGSLWDHRPITDFWMIARGRSSRLAKYGIYTMRQLAEAAFADDSFLYKEFGVDAEMLIDHAFGVENVRMSDIKGYQSTDHSLSMGQVLLRDYRFDEAKIIVKEMTDSLCLQMASRLVETDSITFYIAYSHTWRDEDGMIAYTTGATVRSRRPTDREEIWRPLIVEQYEKTTHRDVPIRRIGICCNHVVRSPYYQYSLIDSGGEFTYDPDRDLRMRDRSMRIHNAVSNIRRAYGKNAILKGMDLEDAATQMERNRQIGGHKANGFNPAIHNRR